MAAKRDRAPHYRGDLQGDVMQAAWKLAEARVEDIRGALPRGRQPAYNTVQTVMNRLVERGLLTRERSGSAYVYRPVFEEADYVARSIGDRLASASPSARRVALTALVDDLDAGEVDALTRYVNRIRRARGTG